MTGASPGLLAEVHDLVETYGRLLDENRLEDWLDLFAETCHYEIVSRENRAQKLPLSLMLCDNKDMLRDRIYSLREANIYNIHYDCHVIGLVRVSTTGAADGGGGIQAGAAYALYQSTEAGETRLFSVGRYGFELGPVDGRLRIRRVEVVVDTGTVLTLLATPI